MACACKVSQNITYLQKKYGVKEKVSKKTNIKLKVKVFFKKIIIGFICILFFPIFLILVLFNGTKTININNLMQKLMHPLKKIKN